MSRAKKHLRCHKPRYPLSHFCPSRRGCTRSALCLSLQAGGCLCVVSMSVLSREGENACRHRQEYRNLATDPGQQHGPHPHLISAKLTTWRHQRETQVAPATSKTIRLQICMSVRCKFSIIAGLSLSLPQILVKPFLLANVPGHAITEHIRFTCTSACCRVLGTFQFASINTMD